MDTHDVSDLPEYLQYLRGHKRTLQNALSKRGQRPRMTKSRAEIERQFMFRQMMNKAPVGHGTLRSSFVPPTYTPCITPLKELKKVMINDLTLETHHRGSYVLLRAVTPTDTMTAIMTIVEDETENVLMLQLYNREKEFSADKYIDEGTVMIVKEPYLKVMADGDYGIRVDHLSDVIFISKFSDEIPLSWRGRITEDELSVNDWKLKGNERFQKAAYHFAIECYSKALECFPTDDEGNTIRLNRALVFLKTRQFDAALCDLQREVSEPTLSEKLLFRKAKSLYFLQRFRESCDVHTVLKRKYPTSSLSKEEFNRAIARLAEQKTGKYRFKQMQLEAIKDRPIDLDHATYTGPVCVRLTKSCGRGLFTTKAVKAGDLLFCEKAFAYAFHDTKDPNKDLSLLINAQTNAMTIGAQIELLETSVQKLYKNPSLISVFNDLYHGSYKSVGVSEVDGVPIVDTFLAERIMSLNGFGCPLSSHESHTSSMRQETQLRDNKSQFHSCGIWPLASHINHSCNSNARRSFIGDMMIVRATRDLPPNSEITFWYKSPFDSDSRDKGLDLAHWGFKCSCIICQDHGNTETIDKAKRKRLRGELATAFQTHRKPNTARIQSILNKIAETYHQPASEIPRLGIWDGYLSLAMVFRGQNQPLKAIEFSLKALESLGYVIEGGKPPFISSTTLVVKQWGLMVDGLVGCWMCLSGAYREVLCDLEAKAEEYAKITYRVCVGEDETFEETYGKLSERVDGLLARRRWG